MKKNKKDLKKYFVDVIICFVASILVIVVFGFYFYNVFVKFQISYAKLYNNNVLAKSTELYNDIVIVSNSLFKNADTNSFLINHYKTINPQHSDYLKNCIANSTISNYVSDVIIEIPKSPLIYSTNSRRKMNYNDFIATYPEYSNIIDKNFKGTQITTNEENVIYSYKDYSNRIVHTSLNKNVLKSYLLEHVYPIFYGTAILNSDETTIITNIKEDYSQIEKNIKGLKNESVSLKGNYLIVKNSTTLYSAVSVIKLSDMFRNALNTGSFLFVVLFLILMFIGIIIYYFYFRHKKLILNHSILKENHLDMNVNHITQKFFTNDIITANDKIVLNDYFLSNGGKYFIPVLVGITNYKEFLETTSFDDITLLKHNIQNIIFEIMTKITKVKILNMEKELIGILIYSDTPINFDALRTQIKNFVNNAKKNFNTELFVTIGIESEDFLLIQKQIPKLIIAQNYSFIKKEHEVLLSGIPNDLLNVPYPITIQNEILMKLNSHDKETLRKSFRKFADYIIENKYPKGKEWFLKLFLFISQNAHTISDISINHNTLENIMGCNKITEIIDVLTDSIEFLDAQHNAEVAENAFEKNMKKFIEEEFSNSNFCIQSITSQLDITSQYLGKKFKHHFNKSFNQYLLEYRINHAMKLLKESEYTTEKIATLCGFNSRTYFVTNFKKIVGISPKEYRNKHKKRECN